MGFLDALLGRRKVKGPAPDRLFAITTAYVDLESQQGIKTRGKAAIVFQPLGTSDFQSIVAEMARAAQRWLLVSVPREPLWRGLNMARGAYLRDLGNTPGHVNHWSKRSFVSLLSRHGEVVEARSPFPWTMLLVKLG